MSKKFKKRKAQTARLEELFSKHLGNLDNAVERMELIVSTLLGPPDNDGDDDSSSDAIDIEDAIQRIEGFEEKLDALNSKLEEDERSSTWPRRIGMISAAGTIAWTIYRFLYGGP